MYSEVGRKLFAEFLAYIRDPTKHHHLYLGIFYNCYSLFFAFNYNLGLIG